MSEKTTLLLVDDDEVFRRVLSSELEQRFFQLKVEMEKILYYYKILELFWEPTNFLEEILPIVMPSIGSVNRELEALREVVSWAAQNRVDGVDFAAGRAVDDARATQALEQPDQRAQPHVALAVDDFEREVGTVRRTRDQMRFAQAERLHDGLAHAWGRGRREREDRRAAERAQALSESPIGGSEVMTPFRDTVGFVDCGQPDARLF